MTEINILFKERELLIEELVEFNNKESNRICSLDGEWGSGKSFFIDKFIEQVKTVVYNKKKNFDILKFDAWENQGNGNINAIFIESIYDDLLLREYFDKPFFEYIKDHYKKWIGGSAKTLIKSIVPEIIGEATDGVSSEYQEFQEKLVYQTFGNQMLNQIIDEKKFYEIMIDMLAKSGKYLIIIDELDRCEPKFAMEIIKKVVYLNKAFKEKEKSVNFLISINKVEFANLLIGYYGSKYDTCQYFDKIFDYEFDLPGALSAYEYLSLLLTKPSNEKTLSYELNKVFSSKLIDKFENLNYRKLQILSEKIQCERNRIFFSEYYKDSFCIDYYYDRVRFIIEVLKLSNHSDYYKIKAAIIRLKKIPCRIDIYDLEITLPKDIVDKNQFFDDVKMISTYFKKEYSNKAKIFMTNKQLLTDSENEKLSDLMSCEILCLMNNYPL